MNFKLLALVLGAVALFSAATFFFIHRHRAATGYANYDATGVPSEVLEAFNAYVHTYKKVYTSKDVATYRLREFYINYNNIQKANANPANTYVSGINQFSDMSLDEFKLIILMQPLPQPTFVNPYKYNASRVLADSVDWRNTAVTPIKNQGSCGSCWSFSTTGVLEGTSALQGAKKLQSFAEQQLVDCCGKDGFQCEGCSGAWPEWALNYVQSKGITTEDKYPYTGVEGNCNIDAGDFHIKNYQMITTMDEDAVVQAVNDQPVSICVDASSWFSYSSGVFNGCTSTGQYSLDHAVLIVGYTPDYYIVKNSWDTTWGEQGFIRLPRSQNACGLAQHAITTFGSQ